MSRTNHHQTYGHWNLVDVYYHWGWKTETYKIKRRVHRRVAEPREWILEALDSQRGNETWDLRFYAGCKGIPQVIRRTMDTYGSYAWRFHHGRNGVAKTAADKWEAKFRGDTRRYEDECRTAYNAGYDVDDVLEPGNRPRSIEYDLW